MKYELHEIYKNSSGQYLISLDTIDIGCKSINLLNIIPALQIKLKFDEYKSLKINRLCEHSRNKLLGGIANIHKYLEIRNLKDDSATIIKAYEIYSQVSLDEKEDIHDKHICYVALICIDDDGGAK